MPTFEIPDGPTAVDAPRSGAKPAETSATYSVTNTSPDAVDGRIGVRVSGASKDEWFAVDGNRERTFGPNETQTATVRITFPSNTPEGDYPFRLRVIAVNDPDNDHAEGPMTTARLGPGGPAPRSLLWLWILLGLLAVAVIGCAAYYMLNRTAEVTTPPPPPPPPPPAALDTGQAMKLAEKKTGQWFAAMAERNVDMLVDLSDPPFYLHDGLQFSKAQIKNKYVTVLVPHSDEVKVRGLSSTTLGELKKQMSNTEIPDSLGLKDDDVVVKATMERDGLLFYFRRSATDVQMAGIWG